MVELEEQPVPTGRGELGLEQEPVLFGVDVEVGEVAVAQGDEVPLGAEVVAKIGDDLAIVTNDELDADSSPATTSPIISTS